MSKITDPKLKELMRKHSDKIDREIEKQWREFTSDNWSRWQREEQDAEEERNKKGAEMSKADRKLAEAVKVLIQADMPEGLKVEFADEKSGHLVVSAKDGKEDMEFDAAALLRALGVKLNKKGVKYEN